MTEPTIQQAMSAVMADVRTVAKNDYNSHFNFKFRGIDAVVNAVGPALRTHGVVVTPNLVSVDYSTAQTTGGKPQTVCRLVVRYIFTGPSGDQIECIVPGEAGDAGDKACAKAMSVAYRIALLQSLCLPTDEPDPDSYSYERAVPTDEEAVGSTPRFRERVQESPSLTQGQQALKQAAQQSGKTPQEVMDILFTRHAVTYQQASEEQLHDLAASLAQTEIPTS